MKYIIKKLSKYFYLFFYLMIHFLKYDCILFWTLFKLSIDHDYLENEAEICCCGIETGILLLLDKVSFWWLKVL
jgi:hypothetical protein